MGNIHIDKCIFTGFPAHEQFDGRSGIDYTVEVNGIFHQIHISDLFFDYDFVEKNKNILFALLYNNNWFEDETALIRRKQLEDLIASRVFPNSPEYKLDTLFLYLFSRQEEDGQQIAIDQMFYDDTLWKILYFKSNDEMTYYLKVLDSKGLINGKFSATKFRPNLLEAYSITYEGLNHAIKLNTEGHKSNKCFIAMAFDEGTNEIRKAIKEALIETNFIPVLVDEQHIDSAKTINDEIIADLKRCKFCIADFTLHKKGVYFESGFALGQGKKVIYTCRTDEFEKAHFDIKPLQHILYDTPQQLKKALINKIEAWIK